MVSPNGVNILYRRKKKNAQVIVYDFSVANWRVLVFSLMSSIVVLVIMKCFVEG